MRRKKQEITDKTEIASILASAKIIRIGFYDGAEPYVLPFNFGYADDKIYVHCALEGRKLDIISNNPLVAFEVTVDAGPRNNNPQTACEYGYSYRCAAGTGTASVVKEEWEKIHGLNVLMKQQAGLSNPVYEPEKLEKTAVLRVDIKKISGKRSS